MNFDQVVSTTIYLTIYRIWRRLVKFIEKYLDGPLLAPSTGRQVQPFKKGPMKKGISRHLEQVSLIAMSNRSKRALHLEISCRSFSADSCGIECDFFESVFSL
jgi:hypothetical protein